MVVLCVTITFAIFKLFMSPTNEDSKVKSGRALDASLNNWKRFYFKDPPLLQPVPVSSNLNMPVMTTQPKRVQLFCNSFFLLTYIFYLNIMVTSSNGIVEYIPMKKLIIHLHFKICINSHKKWEHLWLNDLHIIGLHWL